MPPHRRRDRLAEQLLHPVSADALAPPRHRRRVDGQPVREVLEPAEELPVRVFHEPRHDALVALVERVLEVVQPDHKSRCHSRTPMLRVQRTELALEHGPVNLAGQDVQRVPVVEHHVEPVSEHVFLRGLLLGFGLHQITSFSGRSAVSW